MKNAMGAVVALALGIGLAATAGATGTNQQSAMPSPNIQSGSTQQIEKNPVRPQRQAARQLRHKRLAVQKAGKTRMAALKRHNRTQLARLHKGERTRMATLHRRNLKQNQAVGVGSSMPTTGNTNITQPTPNSAGSNQNLNTQPQKQ